MSTLTTRFALPFALLLSAPMVVAQNVYTLEYAMAVPVGDLHTYINDPSFRGFNFGYRSMVEPNTAVGVDLGWQTFFERVEKGTYEFGTSAITGTQYRYTNTFNASLQVDHVFADGKDVRPFIGLGAGMLYAKRRLDVGLYSIDQDSWQFLLQPEAGVWLYLNNGSALMFSLNYFAGMTTKALPGQQYVSFNVGYAFND